MPRVVLRHASGVQNDASTTASVTLAAADNVARNRRLADEADSYQTRAAKTTLATDATTMKSVRTFKMRRSATLLNSGPPGRNRLRHAKAVNAASAIHRSSGSAPVSAAAATRTKKAV